MAELVCVNPADVEKYWPKVSHWIKAALRRTDLGLFSDLEAAALGGRAILWVAFVDGVLQSAALTQIENSENSKSCSVLACGGEGENDWPQLLAGIERYAKFFGCNCMRIAGRKGWARVLKNYKTTMVVLERRL